MKYINYFLEVSQLLVIVGGGSSGDMQEVLQQYNDIPRLNTRSIFLRPSTNCYSPMLAGSMAKILEMENLLWYRALGATKCKCKFGIC